MLLAQISDAAKAAEKAVADASQFGFAAHFLMVFFLVVVGVYLLDWWYVRKPTAKTQCECIEKIANAVQGFAVNDAAKTQILDEISGQIAQWNGKLSDIRKMVAQQHCNVPPACQPHPHGS